MRMQPDFYVNVNIHTLNSHIFQASKFMFFIRHFEYTRVPN